MEGIGLVIFKELASLQEGLTANARLLDDLETTVRSEPNVDQYKLNEIANMKAECGVQIRDNERNMISASNFRDVEDNGFRLLNVYRFFSRNATQIDELLQQVNLQRDDNAILGVIIVTAIMLIYAKI